MEPEITASAPATAATTSTPAPAVAEPAITPETTEAAKASKRAARRAEIVKAARTAAAPAASGEIPKTPASPPAPAAVVPAPVVAAAPPVVAPDPRLTALEQERDALKVKIAEADKAPRAPKTVDELLDLMDSNPDLTIEKISELFLKRQENPGHKQLTEAEKRLKAVEDKIADGERLAKERETKAAQETSAAEGRKQVRGILDGDKGRWPRLTRSEDNISEAIGDLPTKASAKWAAHVAAGKAQTEAEASRIIAEALDDLEKDRAERAGRYSMPDIAPGRRTITADAGSTGTLPTAKPEAPKPKTYEDRKKAILARVRAGQPQTT